MTYITDLKAKVEQLEDVIDGKDLELTLLESELVEVNEPSYAISETTMLIIQMLAEVNVFQRKNGLTPKIKASKERLLRLLDLNGKLDNVATSNYKLKYVNREIHANYQLLRIENKELKQQLKNVELAAEFCK